MSDETTTEEQFVDFKCPACGEEVSFPKSCAGLARECFNCNVPIVVPADGGKGRLIPLPHSTERLTLRRFRDQDWKDLLHLFSDDDFYTAAPVKLDGEEQITRWLEADAVVKLTTPGVPFFLAVLANEGAKVMGFLSLRFADSDMLQANLYLALHKEFQRKGFGAEALKGALQFCFNEITLHRVQAFCESANTSAQRLFEKSGMRREAEFVQDHRVGDQWANTTAYAILRDEFKNTARK